MKYLKLIAVLLFAFVLTSSCKEEDESFPEGLLNITFNNPPQELEINVYSIQYRDIPIWSVLPEGKKIFILPLNAGDYIIKPTSPTVYYTEIAFQIRSGKEISVSYDERNQGKVNASY